VYQKAEPHAGLLGTNKRSAKTMAGRAIEIAEKNVDVTEEEQIRRRAYEVYRERGCQAGTELDDWLQAESELKQKEVKKINNRKSNVELRMAAASQRG
jgi:hypothetical protein